MATIFVLSEIGIGRDDLAGTIACGDYVARISNLPCRRLPVGRPLGRREGCRLEIRDTAQRGTAATELFGVRREAKRHAALAALDDIRKAVSPLRSATALQNRRGLGRYQGRGGTRPSQSP